MTLHPVVRGERVTLARPSPSWFPRVATLINDPRINRTLITAVPWPIETFEVSSWLPVSDPPTAFLIAETGNLERPLGLIHFHSYDALSRSIKLAILLEVEAQNHGFGSEAVRLMVDYGFRTFDLNRIALSAFSSNPGGLRAYERAGFRREGVRRRAWFRDGAWHDDVVMAVCRSDWEDRA